MWKKQRGLWVISYKSRADRPHWITIAIGCLSPLLACLALVISVLSLRATHDSVRIANRAYVDVIGGNLRFSDYGYTQQEEKPNSGAHCVVRMDITATIQNAGNSPASVGKVAPRYRLPKGWSEPPAWIKTPLANSIVGVVGPKSATNFNYTELFELTPTAYNAFRNFPGLAFVYMDARVDYKDVFNGTTTLKWCWVAAGNERRTVVTDCTHSFRIALDAQWPGATN